MTPQTMIVEDGSRITVHHFAVPVAPEGLAVASERQYRIACAPRMADLTAAGRLCPPMRTDDPRVVNCPLCQISNEYKAAMEEIRNARRVKR